MFGAIALRRLGAFSVDWAVIALWGTALFGIVMLLTHGEPMASANPWMAQFLAFLCMTGPVILYFTFCECSSMQASLGKRVLKLRVLDEQGRRLRFASSLKRNLIKFLPWELGHMGAQQAFYAGEAGPALWVWVPLLASMIIPVLWFFQLLKNGAAPYDLWAGARVQLQPAG